MEPKRVLVLNERVEDASSIEETYKASAETNFEVSSVFKAEDAVNALSNSNTDLLVFNLKDFSKKKLNAVIDLRQLGIDFPLLSIAETYDQEAYQFVKDLDNSVLLNKPYSDKQLVSLSSKMLSGQSVVQRRFPRFVTKEKAFLSLYPNGSPTKVTLEDLSKGGARILAPLDSGVQAGDTVRIKFYLESVDTHHHFTAVVRWMELISDQGIYYIGLKFLSESQIFKSLLSKS